MKHVFLSRRGLLLFALLTTSGLTVRAQNVGIGTTAPDASAALDIVSTSKGALLPRVASTGSVSSPATGLIVFQTGAPAGYYYNAGTPGTPSWQQLINSTQLTTVSNNISSLNAQTTALNVQTSNLTNSVNMLNAKTTATDTNVASLASSAVLSASNGLTKTGQDVALGGTLTKATTVAQGSNFFALTGAGQIGLGTATATGIAAHVTVQTSTVAETGLQVSLTGSSTAIAFKTEHNGSNFIVRPVSAGGSSTAIENTGGGALALNPTMGNVGIGTVSPTALLDVAGSARIEGLTTAGLVQTDASGNLSSATAASLDPTTASNGLTKVGSDFRLGGTLTGATTIGLGANNLSFTSTTGTVGIGATSAARLHVRGLGNAYPTTTGTTQSAGLISRFQTSDNAILDLGGNSVNGFWLQSTDITNLGQNYPLMLNPNGGNVGIGTTAPAEKLDVVGNIQSSANIAIDYGNANAGTVANALHFGPTNSGEAIGSKRTAGGNQYGLDFYTINTNRMSITPAGNVGIGTTTPATKLDVNGSLRLAVRLCPVNQANYTLTAADIAYSIFKLQDGAYASSLTLPPAGTGQVEGQELTIVTAANPNNATSINGTNTDNGTAVVLGGLLNPVHAVKYVWAINAVGTGTWYRVQ